MSIKILCVLLVLAVVTYGFPQGYQQQNLDPAFGRYPNQGFQNGPGNFGQPGFGQEGFGQGGFPGQGGYGNIAGSHPGGYKEHGY
ncbi:holotricin-3-like isoform X2 [Danaus plexippus]|uniref:holotricin-3-like isoform X3 n=1 Tax=Danaus plexippus TaxID=13037 RepID=UPI002AB1EA0B|nr:holotricin-3-like isoform X3 [Danaus plexippus]XP_032519721.2 holotricin-3-like isoform X2 [Danaus plexippus]